VKVEEFEIEGIPPGYQVFDVDLTPSGRPVATVGHPIDASTAAYALSGDVRIELPTESICYTKERNGELYAHVRCAGEEHVVVAFPRVDEDGEINAWTFGPAGQLVGEFHAGDDIQELLASERWVVAFYSDEGQLGDIRLSNQAMSVLGLDGSLLWGHRSHFPQGQRLETWFHAACWMNEDDIGVFADVETGGVLPGQCSFLEINVRNRTQTIRRPPGHIARPDAVTASPGGLIRVHGLIADFMTNRRAPEIVEWDPSRGSNRVVGEYEDDSSRKHPVLRGLPGGRFIAPTPDGYRILSFDD